MEEILSPDDDSCNSSRLSNKSEKNMADFDGEDALSDEDMVHSNTPHMAHSSTPQRRTPPSYTRENRFQNMFYHNSSKHEGMTCITIV